jgi:hypothetical protein
MTFAMSNPSALAAQMHNSNRDHSLHKQCVERMETPTTADHYRTTHMVLYREIMAKPRADHSKLGYTPLVAKQSLKLA